MTTADDISAEPPFAHRPYQGPSQPFTVGLKPINLADWLEVDRYLGRYLDRKAELIADRFATVFRAEAGTEDAQQDVLDLVLEHLRAHHAGTHLVEPEQARMTDHVPAVALGEKPALLTASRLVQEDLVLMRPGPHGYRLAAASLCFPSSWSLVEKFGQSMHGIHENVPGFNGHRMGQVVRRLFDNLTPEQLVCRFNWSIYDDPDLHHPQPKQLGRLLGDMDNDILAAMFIRVERQTLRRLPRSGDILFTIKVHHDPLAVLSDAPDAGVMADGLRAQLLALDSDQLAYKGLGPHRDRLASALEALAKSVEKAT